MSVRGLIPQIHRAREYRLYDGRRRYLDFWQENGHALLGHRPGRVRLEIKNRLDRGLLAAYPCREERLLKRSLAMLLPERKSFRWYWDRERLVALIADVLGTGTDPSPGDPAIGCVENREVAYWRPWLSNEVDSVRIVLPVLPLPGSSWLNVVAISDELPPEAHPSDPVSPTVLSGLGASIHELIAYLGNHDTSGWEWFDAPFWVRRGPYLRFTCPESDFPSLYRDFLSHGMILAPDWNSPSIIPGSYDPGEVRYIRDISAR